MASWSHTHPEALPARQLTHINDPTPQQVFAFINYCESVRTGPMTREQRRKNLLRKVEDFPSTLAANTQACPWCGVDIVEGSPMYKVDGDWVDTICALSES